MKRLYQYLHILLLLIILSCTKVVNINLNDANPNIVIEGIVTNDAGPYHVRITRTVDFSAPNIFPPVPGALVIITDSTGGITDSLTEKDPGIYSTHESFQGVPGHTFLLSVLLNGQTFTATSTMPEPVKLDSVTFYNSNIFGNVNYNAVANFQDPAGVLNYYTFTETISHKRLDRVFDFNDRLSDGKYIRLQLFNDSTYIEPGDEVSIEMNCVDKHVWEYFNTLGPATGNNFQSVSPTNPISNISNKALGYFSAQTTETGKSVLK